MDSEIYAMLCRARDAKAAEAAAVRAKGPPGHDDQGNPMAWGEPYSPALESAHLRALVAAARPKGADGKDEAARLAALARGAAGTWVPGVPVPEGYPAEVTQAVILLKDLTFLLERVTPE